MKLSTQIRIRNLLSWDEYETRKFFEAAKEAWIIAEGNNDPNAPELLETRDIAYADWMEALDALQDFEAQEW